jgi:hypothetical protein
VDGIHPNDCGFYFMTREVRKTLEPIFRSICGKNKFRLKIRENNADQSAMFSLFWMLEIQSVFYWIKFLRLFQIIFLKNVVFFLIVWYD